MLNEIGMMQSAAVPYLTYKSKLTRAEFIMDLQWVRVSKRYKLGELAARYYFVHWNPVA